MPPIINNIGGLVKNRPLFYFFVSLFSTALLDSETSYKWHCSTIQHNRPHSHTQQT